MMNSEICAVCGDNAIGKNFNAWTCQSCRFFFKRNAKKSQNFICLQGGYCLINIATRRKCRKCRMEKCLAVGMKPEYIWNDEQKAYRKNLIEENRKKRLKSQAVVVSELSADSECRSVESRESEESFGETPNPCTSVIVMRPSLCSEESVSDESFCSQSLQSIHLTDEDIREVEEMVEINEMIDNCYKSYNSSAVAVYHPFDNNDKSFNQMEQMMLTELFQVLNNIEKIIINPKLINVKQDQGIMYHYACYYNDQLRKLNHTVRQLRACDNIGQSDQLSLVSSSAVEILALRSVLKYNDTHVEVFNLPIVKDSLGAFRMAFLKHHLKEGYAVYKNTWNCIAKECDADSVIFDLLTAIVLFNPNKPSVANREEIDYQRRIYMHLLQRYLFFKYGNRSESKDKYSRLMNMLIFLHIIGNLEKRYIYEQNPHIFGAVIKKFFNLNSFSRKICF